MTTVSETDDGVCILYPILNTLIHLRYRNDNK